MFHERAPVTGSWDNIIVLIRSMLAAGLCRVESSHSYLAAKPEGANVTIVLGDDSAVRAYYARCYAEQESLREAGHSYAAQEVLIRYQERSSSVNERPYSLATNIYGWAMGSLFLSNLEGGRFAITDRGATLEECIALGCQMASARGAKGTTLSFGVTGLGVSIEQAAELVRVAGGTNEQIEWVLGEPAREAARKLVAQELAAKYAAERAARDAHIAAGAKLIEAVRAPFVADRSCNVTTSVNGLTLRGKTHNPSLTCTITGNGFTVDRADFDGVHRQHSRIAEGLTPPTTEEIVHALQGAWAVMKAGL